MDLQVNTQMDYRWTRDGLTYGLTDGLTGKHTDGLQMDLQMERWTYRWTRDGLTYGPTDGLTGKHTNGIQNRDGLIDGLTYVLQIDYKWKDM